MSIEYCMPSLGPDMEAGTLVEWRVKPGDTVKRGDVVVLVETDKGIIDVEVFADATVERLLVEPGAHVAVGTPIALFSGEPAPSKEVPRPEPRPAASPEPVAVAVPSEAPAPSVGPHPRVKISPAARARAQALGIDPELIHGTARNGVISLDDVEAHARMANEAPRVAEHGIDMRQVIAKAMSRSKREIPHYYLTSTVSFLAARAWLDAYNAKVSIEERLLPAALLVRAVALAARALPDFNGHYSDEHGFVAATDVNVGVAIAMRGGRLVAPAILATDAKPLPQLMRELRDLAGRVRSGHMRGSELSQPTITVTSLAEDGPDVIVPVIYPPQVAMVGCGAIVERPWVVEGVVRPAPVVSITLAADHRVTDGRAGARFLTEIRDRLLAPETL